MIVVTHEMAFARDVFEHVVYMADGAMRKALDIAKMLAARYLADNRHVRLAGAPKKQQQ